jgi:hypothetical protein
MMVWKFLFTTALIACVQSSSAQDLTQWQRECVMSRSVNGLPLFEAVGVSGYSRNLCTGQLIVGSKELAKLNKQMRDSWAARGYKCTVDCSGHNAGHEWAEDEEITEESQCDGGNSRSFIEGCKAYVRAARLR